MPPWKFTRYHAALLELSFNTLLEMRRPWYWYGVRRLERSFQYSIRDANAGSAISAIAVRYATFNTLLEMHPPKSRRY